MTKNKKHTKKQRQQPKPKAKKIRKVALSSANKSDLFEKQMRMIGKKIFDFFKDTEAVNATLREQIDVIIDYFRKYDTIQLLGSIGLYLLDNLPNLEKSFTAHLSGSKMELDEHAEVIAEYAMNFGLSMANEGKEQPTNEVVSDLKNRLKTLFMIYLHLDMPLVKDPMQSIDWIIHMETIAVRGDGYQTHVCEVFKEMFYPHTIFYQQEYGYSVENLFDFFMDLENRVICKIADQNHIYGVWKMHERWTTWEKKTYGSVDEDFNLNSARDFSKGLFGDFFEANPDVPHTEDGMNFLLYEPDDYTQSDKIFWIYPQNDTESEILNSLSMEFGDNACFIAEGEFKGNIMNGSSIFEKPFIKDNDKYYCFTPMIPHRNLFLIAEKLMKRNEQYYQRNFQQNSNYHSRDNYIERKVKYVMESFLLNVVFYPSVHYTIIENGVKKNTELDILGISDKANYIIEVKAHELSYKDRVGLEGAKTKFKASVTEACRQCSRAVDFISDSENPEFGMHNGNIEVDKTKPIHKIVVTFQHYSTLLGHMDVLVQAGLLEDRFRDTWIVSLFDLMVVSDFIESEDEFLSYLNMHKIINTNHSTFHDELDVFGQFLNENLVKKIKSNKPTNIVGGHNYIDDEYSKDYEVQTSSNLTTTSLMF